jgi:hypothetical protein
MQRCSVEPRCQPGRAVTAGGRLSRQDAALQLPPQCSAYASFPAALREPTAANLLVGVFGALCAEERYSHEVIIPRQVPAVTNAQMASPHSCAASGTVEHGDCR